MPIGFRRCGDSQWAASYLHVKWLLLLSPMHPEARSYHEASCGSRHSHCGTFPILELLSYSPPRIEPPWSDVERSVRSYHLCNFQLREVAPTMATIMLPSPSQRKGSTLPARAKPAGAGSSDPTSSGHAKPSEDPGPTTAGRAKPPPAAEFGSLGRRTRRLQPTHGGCLRSRSSPPGQRRKYRHPPGGADRQHDCRRRDHLDRL